MMCFVLYSACLNILCVSLLHRQREAELLGALEAVILRCQELENASTR